MEIFNKYALFWKFGKYLSHFPKFGDIVSQVGGKILCWKGYRVKSEVK